MTGTEFLDMLMARCGRTGNATLRAAALLEAKHYQRTMLEKGEIMPDFLVVYDQSITLTAGNRRFTLPTDFLRELDEDETLWILDDNGEYQPMTKVGFDDPEFTRSETGDLPLKYAVMGLYGYTFPQPTVNRTLKMNYYGSGGTIADDGNTTVWLTHAEDLMLGGAGTIINSLYVKDPELTQIFGSLESRGRIRLLNEQTARQEAGRSRRMG